ncbi:DUF6020 family protein [Atopobium sp. oral taxon 810]|uniref:DUF6020 family protein n=1 Tax=Atopobium sp. oral taxon 810 TaxID=712158 RepID=UPI000407E136|nr:DUF6020 family protein [Atopobium sp. oral taxon 810]
MNTELKQNCFRAASKVRSLIYSLLITFAFIAYNPAYLETFDNSSLSSILMYISGYFSSIKASLPVCVMVIVIYYIHQRGLSFGHPLATSITGLIAAIVSLMGLNYLNNNGLEFLAKGGIAAGFFSLSALIGFKLAFTDLFTWLDSCFDAPQEKNIHNRKAFALIFDKYPFVTCSCILLIFWLPYLTAVFPGVLHIDALTSLNYYYGTSVWTTHFPPVSVMLMGFCMDIGKYLGSDNLGIALYVIPQFIICLATLAFGFSLMKKWRTPYWIRALCLMLFSFLPVIPMYAVTEVKDTYYCVAFMWLTYFLLNQSAIFNKRTILLVLFTTYALCLFRNDGKFICLFVVLIVLLSRKKWNLHWGKIVATLLCGFLLATVTTRIVVKRFNIQAASIREVFSLPAQQTARYVSKFNKDLTTEERASLNNFFSGNLDKLGALYNHDFADPVKNAIVFHPSKEQLREYFRNWTAQLLKHPGIYLSATFNQTYGYYFPEKLEFYNAGFSIESPSENAINYHGDIVITHSKDTQSWRATIIQWAHLLRSIPLSRPFYSSATYTWIILIALVATARRVKVSRLVPFSLPVGIFIMCCLSPVNGAFRYSLSLVLSSFFYFSYAVYLARNR